MIVEMRKKLSKALSGEFDNLNHVDAYGESYFLLSFFSFLGFAGIAGYIYFTALPMKLDMDLCTKLRIEFPSVSCGQDAIARLGDLRSQLAILLRPDPIGAGSPVPLIFMFAFLFMAKISAILFRFSGAIEINNRRKFRRNMRDQGFAIVKQSRFEEALEAFVEKAEQNLKIAMTPLLPVELEESDAASPAIIEISERDRAFLEQLEEILLKEISNPAFRVEELAAALGISKQTLDNKLKALLDCTPAAFMTECRICLAKQLLMRPGSPVRGLGRIEGVAKSVGYKDIASFRERFKEIVGVTPSRYKG